MPTLNRIRFYAQVQDLAGYYNVNSYTGGPAPYDVSVAWEMYRHAANPVNGFLAFGRTNIERPAGQRLPGALEDIDLWNLGATNDDLGSRQDYIPASFQGGGAVLRYKTTNGRCAWHELYNHAWLLGGVHAGVPFHSASPRTQNMIVSGNGPSMWGHELLFLDFFGYWPRRAFGQEIWKPLTTARNKSLKDFVDYFRRIKNNIPHITSKVVDPAAAPAPATAINRVRWANGVGRR